MRGFETMAQSFWSRRRDGIDTAGSYMRATETVSRPTAILMGMLAVFAIVGVLFGVFWGARTLYTRLTNNDDSGATTSQTTPTTTVTSSTSTSESNAPKTTAVTTPPPVGTTPTAAPAVKSLTNTGPSSIPNTGPASLED